MPRDQQAGGQVSARAPRVHWQMSRAALAGSVVRLNLWHLAAGAALLAIDEVMTLWADDPSLRDPLDLLEEALQILDGPSIFPQKP